MNKMEGILNIIIKGCSCCSSEIIMNEKKTALSICIKTKVCIVFVDLDVKKCVS